MLAIKMFLIGWFYRWKTRRETIQRMTLKPRDEVLLKMKEFERKLITAQKTNGEVSRYENYIEVMKWMLKEE